MDKKTGPFNRFINSTVILYIVLWLLQPVPNRTEGDISGIATYTMILATVVFIIYLAVNIAAFEKNIYVTTKSITGTVLAVLGLWVILTAKTGILEEALFPSPEIVLRQMFSDSRLLGDILSSLITLGKGYLSALVLGIFLGSVLGMSRKFGNSITYITTFLKLIPPIVYIPYAIALLPRYESVSTFVIFMSSFWPIFSSTYVGVKGVEKQYLDSARVLNVGFFSRMINVILPASLSEIFIGCNQGLAYSFIMLTSAEMIGGSAGIGYYIKYYSNFGDFTRIIVGILVIGIIISIITFLISKLENHLLRWKPK